jgi:hypothetical protein
LRPLTKKKIDVSFSSSGMMGENDFVHFEKRNAHACKAFHSLKCPPGIFHSASVPPRKNWEVFRELYKGRSRDLTKCIRDSPRL